MRDHLAELGDAEVAVVTFTPPERLVAYRRHLDVPFSLLYDADRSAYAAYGLGRGPWWRVYGPPVWREYAHLLARGRRLQRPTEDTLQLGGDFVVGRDGRLAYAFFGQGPDDRPDAAQLVEAARRA